MTSRRNFLSAVLAIAIPSSVYQTTWVTEPQVKFNKPFDLYDYQVQALKWVEAHPQAAFLLAY